MTLISRSNMLLQHWKINWVQCCIQVGIANIFNVVQLQQLKLNLVSVTMSGFVTQLLSTYTGTIHDYKVPIQELYTTIQYVYRKYIQLYHTYTGTRHSYTVHIQKLYTTIPYLYRNYTQLYSKMYNYGAESVDIKIKN